MSSLFVGSVVIRFLCQRKLLRAAASRRATAAPSYAACVKRRQYCLQLGDFRHRTAKMENGWSIRNPHRGDTAALATLVLEAYRGTLDDEGEDEDAARAFVVSSLADELIASASWMVFEGGEPRSAIDRFSTACTRRHPRWRAPRGWVEPGRGCALSGVARPDNL